MATSIFPDSHTFSSPMLILFIFIYHFGWNQKMNLKDWLWHICVDLNLFVFTLSVVMSWTQGLSKLFSGYLAIKFNRLFVNENKKTLLFVSVPILFFSKVRTHFFEFSINIFVIGIRIILNNLKLCCQWEVYLDHRVALQKKQQSKNKT